jgi:hypothetical protein
MCSPSRDRTNQAVGRPLSGSTALVGLHGGLGRGRVRSERGRRGITSSALGAGCDGCFASGWLGDCWAWLRRLLWGMSHKRLQTAVRCLRARQCRRLPRLLRACSMIPSSSTRHLALRSLRVRGHGGYPYRLVPSTGRWGTHRLGWRFRPALTSRLGLRSRSKF